MSRYTYDKSKGSARTDENSCLMLLKKNYLLLNGFASPGKLYNDEEISL
jgi:hypothetical protein